MNNDPILILMVNGMVQVTKNRAIVIGESIRRSHQDVELAEARKKADGDGKPKRIAPRQPRNEKCACGSGKKFKHCCIS